MDENKKTELIKQNIACIKLYIEGKRTAEESFMFSTDFTSPVAWTFHAYPEHISFLKQITELKYPSNIVNGDLLKHWKLANNLIIMNWDGIKYNQLHTINIKEESLNLACVVLFPVIEEMARIVSGYWNEDGLMLEDAPTEVQFVGQKGNPRFYKKNDSISSLFDKLKIMQYTLPESIQKFLQELSRAMEIQPINGMTIEIPPFYKQLEIERNRQLHGRKFRGNIAVLLSLVITLIYLSVKKDES